MKKLFFLFSIWVLSGTSYAQPVLRQSIQDSIIGWMKVYHFKGIKESKKVDDKLYSAAQLSLCDSFANWMQASYLPKGGLGDVKKSVSEKLGQYNQHTVAKPQSYGAYSKTYFELKYNSNHKLEPFTNSHVNWNIFANNIPGDWPIRDLCTPSQYYFTMPTSETEVDDEKIKKLLDLTTEESIKPYITFWIKNMGYGGGRENVLLCKDNKSPLIKVTKGEYLQALESAIPRYYEAEKKKIFEQNKDNQKSIDYFMLYLNEKNDKRVACLKNNKEKYKDRLTETAEVFNPQPDLMLENYPDVFEGNDYQSKKFPVYKIDPEMAELCKKDKPQWILISWDYYSVDPTEKQQHEAIINNFNFGYVYNFFFDPGKVKGQPYKPLRSPDAKED